MAQGSRQPHREVAEAARPSCAGSDVDAWFSDDPRVWAACRAVCVTCPLVEGCLSGALQRREWAGVWGGVVFPMTVRSVTTVRVGVPRRAPAGVSGLAGVVWRLRWVTGRGELVEFGAYPSEQAARAAARPLLYGLRHDGQGRSCAA